MKVLYTRALGTGATGFVGAHLVRQLQVQGVEVATFSLPEGDITDVEAVERAVEEAKPEVIFHLAAYGTFGHEKDVPRMVAVNITGTYHLLSAAVKHGCTRFIFAASAKEYATSRVPITEDTPLSPWDDYAVTKAAATFFCRLFSEKHDISVSVLRLSPVFGPGDSPSRFVLTAVRAALEGTPFTISVGPLVRNFTYIDDVVEVYLLASVRSGEKYEEFNVAADEAHSFEDILQAIEQVTGKKISRQVTPYPGKGDDSWVLDNSKAKRLLAWEPGVTLEEGIRRTVEWYHQTK
ncbi:MAG: NAD-dependent epimerase/dehydratase family protein [Patescibacteria group bacterium]